MSTGEILYLALVVFAGAAFAVTLAYIRGVDPDASLRKRELIERLEHG